ncbi:MAG: cytidylate kinase-like family protein, partial [Deltaproteobacteria bacterium]|nr:cytidylate kinase-like family protein [Deltaproteobacteria bacterium]
MQIVCISRGSFGYGKELAERLADQLGCACVSRETLTDEATGAGIPVGKIETAIVKNRPLSESLAIEADLFKAHVTASLCEKALKERVVYHGRTGHLVLPGLTTVLRVRAIADMEDRIQMVMNRMRISRDRAKSYIDQVGEDIRRWVRNLYNVAWDDPSLFDITLNSAHLSVENASRVLLETAQLPDFQPTPASTRQMQDLLLGARCRLAIGQDPETHDMKVTVRAEQGAVSVLYLPHQAARAGAITNVIKGVEGVKSFVCTVATTNILYLAEKFDPDSESFDHLVEVAEKWNAAVELIRLSSEPVPSPKDGETRTGGQDDDGYDGGILDEAAAADGCESEGCGVPETMHKLIKSGRAGGYMPIQGGTGDLVRSLSGTKDYSLIVVGDVYCEKGAAAQHL